MVSMTRITVRWQSSTPYVSKAKATKAYLRVLYSPAKNKCKNKTMASLRL